MSFIEGHIHIMINTQLYLLPNLHSIIDIDSRNIYIYFRGHDLDKIMLTSGNSQRVFCATLQSMPCFHYSGMLYSVK